jgi:hypothetical protein
LNGYLRFVKKSSGPCYGLSRAGGWRDSVVGKGCALNGHLLPNVGRLFSTGWQGIHYLVQAAPITHPPVTIPPSPRSAPLPSQQDLCCSSLATGLLLCRAHGRSFVVVSRHWLKPHLASPNKPRKGEISEVTWDQDERESASSRMTCCRARVTPRDPSR